MRGDERPYLEIFVFEKKILGLLDSGASCSLAGKPGFDVLRKMNIHLSPESSQCTVANDEKSIIIGRVNVPTRVRDRVRLCEIRIVPELPHTLILGADFWRGMGRVPDLRGRECSFSRHPEAVVGAIEIRSDLLPEQEARLSQIVEEKMTN